MSDSLQKTILISAVGMSDPFFVKNDKRYGPLLSIALSSEPHEIWLFLSKEIDNVGRYEACVKELKYYLPKTKVELIGKSIYERGVTDVNDIFNFLKNNLFSFLVENPDDYYLFNISSGTPQITSTFKLISLSGIVNSYEVLQAKRKKEIIKVKDENWKNYSINKIVSQYDKSFKKEIELLNNIEHDVFYFTLLTSMNILIDNHEYASALKLIKEYSKKFDFFKSEKKLVSFEAILEGMTLMLDLNIEEAKNLFGKNGLTNFSDDLKDFILTKSIEKSRRILAIRISEIFIKKQNYLNALRYIAILREIILVNLVKELDEKENIFKNPDFLLFCENDSKKINSYSNEHIKSSKAIDYLNQYNKYIDLSFLTIENCKKLVDLRNDISHGFKKVTKSNFEEFKDFYSNLKKIAKIYNLIPIKYPDIFNEFNIILKERMKAL